MGNRGPTGKSTSLKLLQGTYRKDRDKGEEVVATTSIPQCPSFLKGEARREWKRITPELEILGLISKLDLAALAAYCSNWKMFVEADKAINTEGLTCINPRGQLVARPEIAIRHRAMSQMRAFLIEFGMTPVSRGKVTVLEKKKTENPFISFQEGNGESKS